MALPISLIQGLMAQLDPNTGRLKVPVEDTMPPRAAQPDMLPDVPDTPGFSSLRYQPTQADIPSLSMPAQEALSQKYGQYPTFNPGFGTRLVSSLAAGSEGFQRGPMAGLQTGQAYLRAPYQEKVDRFQSEATPLMFRAGVEADNYKRALERAKIQADLGTTNTKNLIDTANANSRMVQEDTRRYNAQTASKQANIRNFIAGQPNYNYKETADGNVPNEIVGFDRKSREVVRTGVSGQGKWRSLEDLKGLLTHKYKEFGRMLRDIPQRDVFGALDNALRVEGQKYPHLYGKFFDKNGMLLSPQELKNFTGEDAKTLERFMELGLKRAQESLAKSKDLKRGIIDPYPTIKLPDGSEILNPEDDDAVPSDDDEEQ